MWIGSKGVPSFVGEYLPLAVDGISGCKLDYVQSEMVLVIQPVLDVLISIVQKDLHSMCFGSLVLIEFWSGLVDWLHYFGLGQLEFSIEQQISNDVLLGEILFIVWDPL